MVEMKTKITDAGVFYVPKELRDAFGLKIKIIPNAAAAVFFPQNARYKDVLTSLQIIQADIEHRIELERQTRGGNTLARSRSPTPLK
jgi:bifunctional DNA-binding transcriptional regulator/antitoxin component of YhaV-PrlF toxin-antitoxin module